MLYEINAFPITRQTIVENRPLSNDFSLKKKFLLMVGAVSLVASSPLVFDHQIDSISRNPLNVKTPEPLITVIHSLVESPQSINK